MSDTYRQSDEWRAVEVAVQNLLNRSNTEVDDVPGFAAEFVLTVLEVPQDGSSTDAIAGYVHFATSEMPHVNVGLYEFAREFWATRSYIPGPEE